MKKGWQVKRYWTFVILVLVLSYIPRIPNINRPLLDAHYFRQTQTATVARNFYLGGIDFFHTKLDIFGEGKEQVLILEFPIYQSVVTLFSRLLGFHDYVGRLVSLVFAGLSGIVLVLITNKLFSDKNIALTALVFFIFNPLNFYFQQTFMIESTVILLYLFSFYAWLKFSRNKETKWLIIASSFTAVAFIHKVVYSPFLFISILGVLVFGMDRKELKKWKCLPGLLFSLLIVIIWQYYVNIQNLENGHSNFVTGSGSQFLWNFGTLSERLEPSAWLSKLSFVQNSVTKYQWPVFLAGIIFLAVKKEKGRFIVFSWVLAMALYYLTLFRIQSHDYYFMLVTPIFSIIAGYGLTGFIKLIFTKIKLGKYQFAEITIIIYLSLFTFKSVNNSKQYFRIDESMLNRLNIYNSVITKPGNILFVLPEYDWNSVYTYYTGRKGKVLSAKDISPQIIKQYSVNGYKYAVLDGISTLKQIGRTYPELLNDYHNLLIRDDLVILNI